MESQNTGCRDNWGSGCSKSYMTESYCFKKKSKNLRVDNHAVSWQDGVRAQGLTTAVAFEVWSWPVALASSPGIGMQSIKPPPHPLQLLWIRDSGGGAQDSVLLQAPPPTWFWCRLKSKSQWTRHGGWLSQEDNTTSHSGECGLLGFCCCCCFNESQLTQLDYQTHPYISFVRFANSNSTSEDKGFCVEGVQKNALQVINSDVFTMTLSFLWLSLVSVFLKLVPLPGTVWECGSSR